MCGIVGYVGARPVREQLLAGLEKLEYRGYDSAGISVLNGDAVDSVRAVGNLDALRSALAAQPAAEGERRETNVALAEPGTGIGHTRWATHGRVSERNAHPHTDDEDRVHVVVNGIVENYVSLQRKLEADGSTFSSETDAEVIAHLIAKHYDGDLTAAVQAAYGELVGHFAFVAMTVAEPGVLVGARRECPLVVGVRMRVALAHAAVRGPARVTDAGARLGERDGRLRGLFRHRRLRGYRGPQRLQVPDRAHGVDAVAVQDRDARAVIAAVLKLFQPGEQLLTNRASADVADDATHGETS